MSDDYIIEKVEKGSEGDKSRYEYRSVSMGSGLPLSVKLKLFGLLIVGAAVGTLLFLFFLTAFIYLFIPALIIFALWRFLNRKS